MTGMSTKKIQVLPSILSARMGHLAADCRRALEAGADGLHFDVMDGHFVANLTLGPDVLRALREELPDAYLHVHLMVDRPDLYAPRFIEAGADAVLVHIESPCDVPGTLRAIRAAGKKTGAVICPETPVEALAGVADAGLLDEVLVMTVHPGFGGQKFLESGLPKFRELRRRWPGLDLSVDGGINTETGALCAAAGANILGAGSFLYKAPDMAAAIAGMRRAAEAAVAAEG
jgi:ribulose-phosphate 3-epimerase